MVKGSGVGGGVEDVFEDEPDAVVGLGVTGGDGLVAKHEDGLVADVDAVASEHGADFGLERGEGFEEEGERDGFALARGGCGSARHEGRIVEGSVECERRV